MIYIEWAFKNTPHFYPNSKERDIFACAPFDLVVFWLFQGEKMNFYKVAQNDARSLNKIDCIFSHFEPFPKNITLLKKYLNFLQINTSKECP